MRSKRAGALPPYSSRASPSWKSAAPQSALRTSSTSAGYAGGLPAAGAFASMATTSASLARVSATYSLRRASASSSAAARPRSAAR